MSDDLVTRLREEIIAEAFSNGHITNGRLADRLIRERLDSSDEIEALRARLEAVERERDDLTQRIHAKGGTADYPTMWAYEQAVKTIEKHRARAERAEAALATARRDALVEAVEKVESLWAYRTCAEVADAIRALANEAET